MSRIRIEIVGDPTSAVRAFRTTRREGEVFGATMRRGRTDMDRFSRGVVAGSGALHGLGRSVAFASSAFLGGAGLLYAFRAVKREAQEAQAIQVRVARAVRNAGESWVLYRRKILQAIDAQSRLSAFDDEELLDTFGKLVVRTRDVSRALELNALAANVARGRNMDLESASRLVLKASIGQAGALRRLGINIKENATATEILTALQQRYARQARDFGRTSAGAQERWNKTLQDSEEIIGKALLPQMDKLLRQATEWLDHQNRSGNLQRVVNQGLEDASAVLAGVSDALKLIKTATEPVVDAIGGVENAATALTLVWLGMKAKAILGFAATATASAVTRTKVVADAALIEAALDAATRPRVAPIVVTTSGVPIPGKYAPYGTGKLPRAPNRPTPSPGKSGVISTLKRYAGPVVAGAAGAYAAAGGGWSVATILAILATAGAGTHREDRAKKYPRVYRAVAAAAAGKATSAQIAILERYLGQYSLENAPDAILRKAESELRKQQRQQSAQNQNYRNAAAPMEVVPPAGYPIPPGQAGPGGRRRKLSIIESDIAAARAGGNRGAEAQYLREAREVYRAQIRSLKRRGDLTAKEQQQLTNAYNQIASINDQLAALAKESETKTKKANKSAADAHEKAALAAKEAAEKIREKWRVARDQAAQAFGELFTGPILGGGMGDFIRQWGSSGATIDPKLILQDMQMQNQQSAKLLADLATITKRGAPKGFVSEIRAMGPAGAGFAAALANAPEAVFQAIMKAFSQRQAQLKQATVFIQARSVVVKTGTGVGPDGSARERAGRMATGGTVPGSGSGDTVPAMLTPGEIVLNKVQQGGLARAMGMPGAGPHELFGKIQRFASGGVVDRFRGWLSNHPVESNVMERVGDWGMTQAKQFAQTIIPTVDGVKAMAGLARDLGLGYNPPYAFLYPDSAARMQGRANESLKMMAVGLLQALRDPINNAGFLAGMFVPLPSKLTAPTKALAAFKARLLRREFHPADVEFQEANLRLKPEKLARTANAFNRKGARITAAQILNSIPPDKLKKALPPGVKTVEDVVKLMEDLYRSAKAGAAGRFWYEQSSREILNFTHGNKDEARKLAQIAAIFSPRVGVEESLKKAASAYESYQRTGKVKIHGKPLGQYQLDQAQAVMEGKRFALGGRKVQNFYLDLMQSIDPKWAQAERARTVGAKGATMDVWMARAFGLAPIWNPKKKKFSSDVTDAQYDFMDMINAGVAGQLGWSRKQTQAGIWTTTKGRWEKSPLERSGTNIGDMLRRQSTQINYEAVWGEMGERIKTELGMKAARQYTQEKISKLLLGDKGQSMVLQRLGLLGQHGGMQQGAWGLDVSPGAHELVVAPRIADRDVHAQGLRRYPEFEKQARWAAAAIGHILNQDAVGTLTEFPMLNAAGNVNAKIRAARNAAWLARKLTDSELAKISAQVGDEFFMTAHGKGWVIKPNKPEPGWFEDLTEKLSGMELQAAAVQSELIRKRSYARLIAQADKQNPGFAAWVESMRRRGLEIDQRWSAKFMGPQPIQRAAGGLVPGSGSGDTVPAMLSPGELVLNRKQQLGVSRALGLGRTSGQALFGEIQRFQHGGVLSGRARSQSSFLPTSSSGPTPAASFQQHNTITVPPQFADTEWAIERGLARATWRLRKGI